MSEVYTFLCTFLELGKLLATGGALAVETDDVEADRLGEGPALADGDNVTLLHAEGRRAVSGELDVALLVAVVLVDVVQVVTADRDGALHLGRGDDARENATADRHVAGERALVVNVRAENGLRRRLEAEADLLVVAANVRALHAEVLADKEVGTLLLLERLLRLSDRKERRKKSEQRDQESEHQRRAKLSKQQAKRRRKGQATGRGKKKRHIEISGNIKRLDKKFFLKRRPNMMLYLVNVSRRRHGCDLTLFVNWTSRRGM